MSDFTDPESPFSKRPVEVLLSVEETLALEQAEAEMVKGNRLEEKSTPEALFEAIGCYEAAWAILRDLALPHYPDFFRLRGLTWMNQGNALQKLSSPEIIPRAIKAYEEAIVWFGQPADENSARDRNTLGAAWMNRGHALHRLGTAVAVNEAILSFQKGLEIFRLLPIDQNPWYRVNFAGAWMNYANTLLSRSGSNDDYLDAYKAAQSALTVIAPLESTLLNAAYLSLQSRRVFCDAVGQLLARTRDLDLVEADLANAASDVVDEGLALARKWKKEAVLFRPVTVRIFYFGIQLYRIHQPHFLAEFLRENLTEESIAELGPDFPEWHGMALETLEQAEKVLSRSTRFVIGDSESERRLQTAKDLTELRIYLSKLDQHYRAASLG